MLMHTGFVRVGTANNPTDPGWSETHNHKRKDV